MAALTDALDISVIKPTGRNKAVPLANAEVFYQGGYYGLNAAGYATAMADTVGLRPLGFLIAFGQGCVNTGGALPTSVTGDTTASIPPEGIFDVGAVSVDYVAVASASAQANLGDEVYLATNNWASNLTTVPLTNVRSVGRIVDYHTSTSFEVAFYPTFAGGASDIGGVTLRQKTMILSTSTLEAQTSANIARWLPPTAGRFVKTHWRPTGFDAYTSGSATIQVTAAALPISGGVLTVAYTALDAIGDMNIQSSGTAITNTSLRATFAKGAVITLAKGGTGLTTGKDASVEVILEYVELPQ